MFAVSIPVALATRHISTFTSSFIASKSKYGQSVRFRGKSAVIFRAVRRMSLYGVVADSVKEWRSVFREVNEKWPKMCQSRGHFSFHEFYSLTPLHQVSREKKVEFGISVKFAIDWTVSNLIFDRKMSRKLIETFFEKMLNFDEKRPKFDQK